MNRCLCCGSIATLYGSGGTLFGGPGERPSSFACMREVCHDCNECGCACGGSKLERPATQVHDRCAHAPKPAAGPSGERS